MNRILIGLLLFTATCFSQKITVADLEIKLDANKTEELMYGFAAGDRIVLTITATGAALPEASVLQYPDILKYKGQNIKDEKQEIKVTDKSVFVFRFANSTKAKRNCRVSIIRIPKNSDTRNFNTAVKWAMVPDTIWNSYTKDVVTGYDTLRVQKTRRVVASESKYEEVVLDKNQRVGAKTGMGDTRGAVAFSLPVNMITKDETKKLVAWAYWVGVGEESNDYWKQNRKLLIETVKGVGTYYFTPLGGLAAGAATGLLLPSNGEDVQYALTDEANKKLFLEGKPGKPFDDGKGIAGYKRFIDGKLLQGSFYMALANDNYVQPIDVTVKVSAIIEHIKYKDEKYMDADITPRYEKKIVREPKVTMVKKPVTFDYKP
jgi:hypothetical protein